jgi:HSP20 family molecular chaperone IbpA
LRRNRYQCVRPSIRFGSKVATKTHELSARTSAKVPGFTAQDIEISAEPQCLFISSKKEHSLEERVNEAVYMAKEVDEVFRVVDLPAQVDPSKAAVTLEDGTLKIILPKTVIEKTTPAD